MKITAIVLSKDEEKNIIDCLDSLEFADEIIVVDDNSKDRTFEILKEREKDDKRLKLFQRSLDNNFSSQRKFAIDKAKNNYIFFLDADERAPKELVEEMRMLEPFYAGYLVKREDFMWGKKLRFGETGSIWLLRLFDKRKGELKGMVHETWETKDRVGRLSFPIYHYPHPTINEFLKDINFYTDIRAKELYQKKVKSGFVQIILYTKAKFFVNYFFKLGFLDGIEGLMHAILMSFHSFMVRGKLWLLWQKENT